MKLKSALLVVLMVVILPLQNVEAFDTPSLQVKILTQDGILESSFDIPTENEIGGAKIAVGDLAENSAAEIVIANGMGSDPTITVYRNDGTEVTKFLAYSENMRRGVTVALCDPDGDGENDIITGTQYGGGPLVRLFDSVGEVKDGEGIMAYVDSFRGGVNVSCGDLDGDGFDELVTTPGPTGGPHVKIWSYEDETWKMDQEFFAFDARESNGVATTVKNGSLFTALQKPKLENPGILEYDIYGKLQDSQTLEQSNFENDSFSTASGDTDLDGQLEIVTVADRPLFTDEQDRKKIIVDLEDQRLYAYENGILANAFSVSTARQGYQTPVGDHSVLAKVEFVHYAWSYGPGNPNNYDLGVQQYNLRIFPHIYIHHAPWHNNFGHPMSHGCVNVNWENIQWIYDWAEEGIPVTVR